MKTPGANGRQGIDISRLEVRKDISMKEAIGKANELIDADDEYHSAEFVPAAETELDGPFISVDPKFVADALDFRRGDSFIVEEEDTSVQGYTVKGGPHHRLLTTVPLTAEPGTLEWDRHDAGYTWDSGTECAELWQSWLAGDAVPVTKQTKYVRTDTGEVVG